MNSRRRVNSTVMLRKEVPLPSDPLTAEQEARIAQLTEADFNAIDAALVSNAKHHWQKVAMVVAHTMTRFSSLASGIPDIFYARRVQKLVAEGGYLRHKEIWNSCGLARCGYRLVFPMMQHNKLEAAGGAYFVR